MKITIKATNFKLTPTIEDYILEKINSLDKFTHGIIKAFVEVGKSTRHHQKGPFFRAEADLRLPGKILRAEAEEKDLYMAIVRVKDELQIEVKKYKEKMIAERKRGARTAKRLFRVAREAQTRADRDLSRRQLDEGI
jgi:putative sigma-54 modulation protein